MAVQAIAKMDFNKTHSNSFEWSPKRHPNRSIFLLVILGNHISCRVWNALRELELPKRFASCQELSTLWLRLSEIIFKNIQETSLFIIAAVGWSRDDEFGCVLRCNSPKEARRRINAALCFSNLILILEHRTICYIHAHTFLSIKAARQPKSRVVRELWVCRFVPREQPFSLSKAALGKYSAPRVPVILFGLILCIRFCEFHSVQISQILPPFRPL